VNRHRRSQVIAERLTERLTEPGAFCRRRGISYRSLEALCRKGGISHRRPEKIRERRKRFAGDLGYLTKCRKRFAGNEDLYRFQQLADTHSEPKKDPMKPRRPPPLLLLCGGHERGLRKEKRFLPPDTQPPLPLSLDGLRSSKRKSESMMYYHLNNRNKKWVQSLCQGAKINHSKLG